MSLQALQSSFESIVLGQDCNGADWVKESKGGLPSKDRLAIYYNAYRIRLIDILRDNFEHTAVYLGDDWFNQLAADYVQNHPSICNNIGYYGHLFAGFIAKQLPDDLEVAELAELDWTLRRAFDGEDSEVLTMETLQVKATTDPENIQLLAVPTLTLTTHTCNTIDIWHAIDKEETPPTVAPLPQVVDVLVWRKGHSPHFRSISPMESAAIYMIQKGVNLNDLGAHLQQQFPDVDVSVEFGQMLHRWLGDEVLAFND
ncbi:DNA-binding domain-containing protein [Grimontia sp. NTOU-MAR1]|uniref:DNA-binding domain-containing protein n=1 Tax=Grimontia sp. NTOU-MAR1 TaxID=3111011 RepID=UPI002DB90420|nr:DNA-binding domain-containing protein [Grimontia sp. NTOU-MAR1]WRW00269.1 DNA-binding domain-containing protein [Grimontia sp. NTOU-MAR1]